MADLRRGWPFPYIPEGKANWIAFVQQATVEQMEQACLAFAYQALLDGRPADAADLLAAVLNDRACRGVGGILQ